MRLLIQSGNPSGQAYELAKDTLAIGRDIRSDISLPDPSVSRTHCQIRRIAGSFVVQDANSINGTFLNNERIAGTCPLRAGDLLRVGNVTFLVQESPASTASSMLANGVARAGDGRSARSGRVSPAQWALVGGGFLGLFIIGLFFALLMNMSGSAVPSVVGMPVPTQTLAPIASTTPATTATRAITPASAAAAAVPMTPTRVLAATPTHSPTLTPAPLPTQVQPSAPQPTRAYPAPRVLYSQLSNKFHRNDPIVLAWTSIAGLGTSDYYAVQIALDSDFNKMACEIRTKDSFVQLPGEISPPCGDNWRFNNIYFWRVRIVSGEFDKTVLLSPEQSDIYKFAWQD